MFCSRKVCVTGQATRAFVADTIFRNVRVLAIGKQLDVKDKEKGADGNVATLELTPRQAELLGIGQLAWARFHFLFAALRTSTLIPAQTFLNDSLKKREQGTTVNSSS